MNLWRSKPQAGKYHNYCNLEKLDLLSALKRKVGIVNYSDLKSVSDCVDGSLTGEIILIMIIIIMIIIIMVIIIIIM